MEQQNEIVLYQPDELTKLEVRVENETVWLTQAQMAELFQRAPQNITMHIRNIYAEGELNTESTCKDFLQVQKEGNRDVKRSVRVYNLDVIISVGYRVKSQRGTAFRIWANGIIKSYLLHGFAINNQLIALQRQIDSRFAQQDSKILSIEQQLSYHDKKIDFFVRTSLPPKEGVFYEGQIFDAYAFASDLVKSATKSLILIDNYIDESVFTLLDKRAKGVTATIYTQPFSEQTQLDIKKHNAQYPSLEVKQTKNIHDRFLIIDDTVYHIGASIKDLGKRLFAFSKMEMEKEVILRAICK